MKDRKLKQVLLSSVNWLMYFVYLYEHRTMNSVAIVLRRGEEG
jgi:hypothetical protein